MLAAAIAGVVGLALGVALGARWGYRWAVEDERGAEALIGRIRERGGRCRECGGLRAPIPIRRGAQGSN